MPKRTIGLVSFTARPGKNRKQHFAKLDNVDGFDLLYVFKAWAEEADPKKLSDYQRGRYLKISAVEATGRYVVATVEAGNFGEDGVTLDAETHEVEHHRTATMAPTIPTRLLFFVPPGAETGVFVIERVGNSTSIRPVLRAFREYLTRTFSTFAFSDETVLETDAWVEGAELLEVRAVAYDIPTDIKDGLDAQPTATGRLQQTLLPDKGSKFLPKALLKGLRKGDITASSFIAFNDDVDIDETFVKVARDGREKMFSVERERVPAIRVLIADDHEDRPTTPEFVDAAVTEVREYFEEVGLTWTEQWKLTPWDDEAAKTLPVDLAAKASVGII